MHSHIFESFYSNSLLRWVGGAEDVIFYLILDRTPSMHIFNKKTPRKCAVERLKFWPYHKEILNISTACIFGDVLLKIGYSIHIRKPLPAPLTLLRNRVVYEVK